MEMKYPCFLFGLSGEEVAALLTGLHLVSDAFRSGALLEDLDLYDIYTTGRYEGGLSIEGLEDLRHAMEKMSCTMQPEESRWKELAVFMIKELMNIEADNPDSKVKGLNVAKLRTYAENLGATFEEGDEDDRPADPKSSSVRGPSPATPVDVGHEHLVRQLTIEEIESIELVTDPLGAVPATPFGHLHETWADFKRWLLPDDRIWSFKIERTDRGGPKVVEIIEGYAVKRGADVRSPFILSRRYPVLEALAQTGKDVRTVRHIVDIPPEPTAHGGEQDEAAQGTSPDQS